MGGFRLSSAIDKEKIFLVSLSEVEGRIDPTFYMVNFDFTNFIKLRNIANVKGGKRLPNGFYYSDTPTDYIYLQVYNLYSQSEIDWETAKYISKEVFDMLERYEIVENDLIFSIAGSIGKINVVRNIPDGKRVILTENAAKICFRKGVNIIPEFMGLVLKTRLIQRQIKLNYIQTTIPKIGLDRVESLYIPNIPSLNEQKAYVEFFTQAQTQKQEKEAQAKALLEGIDDYVLGELGISLPPQDNSLKNRIFTTSLSAVSSGRLDPDYYKGYYINLGESVFNSKYPITKVKKVITFIESGARPQGGVSNINSGILSIGGEHVNEKCEVGGGKAKYIPAEFHKKNLLSETKLYDIILVKDGATTGKIGIIEDIALEGQNINEHVFLIRPKAKKISALYLMHYLHTRLGQDLLKREITGATVTGLTKYSVKNIPIPLPPLEKQNEIAEHISGIRTKAKRLEQEAQEVLEQAKQEVEQMILG